MSRLNLHLLLVTLVLMISNCCLKHITTSSSTNRLVSNNALKKPQAKDYAPIDPNWWGSLRGQSVVSVAQLNFLAQFTYKDMHMFIMFYKKDSRINEQTRDIYNKAVDEIWNEYRGRVAFMAVEGPAVKDMTYIF